MRILYDDTAAMLEKDIKDAQRLMDSSGLGTIVGLYVSAKNAHCELKLTNLNKLLKDLFWGPDFGHTSPLPCAHVANYPLGKQMNDYGHLTQRLNEAPHASLFELVTARQSGYNFVCHADNREARRGNGQGPESFERPR